MPVSSWNKRREVSHLSKILELHQYAEEHRIDVDYFSLGVVESLSMHVYGSNAIAIDPDKIQSEADETYKLAHELGHCEYGGFYNAKSPLDLRGKREYKADVWAVQKVLPFDELREAIQSGIHERWELAEHFNLPEEFINFALTYYLERKGYTID